MNASEFSQQHYYSAAEALEAALGDPRASAPLFSFHHAVELDEREEFPAEQCHLLEEWGLQEYYVPLQYGGKMRHFDEMLALVRIVSRRDLSVAIAHCKTMLGASPVWIAGTEEQRRTLAHAILNREYVSLGLTEEEHGSDLAASECAARKIHHQYLISGTKWLINNATRGSIFSLLARTRGHGGPLGVSLFLVEKNKLDPASFQCLPKIKTHGIKGIDISGVRFENASVGEEAIIGKEHHGLEPIFKTFQITRPLCSALSLGAADTALRLALTFALQRRVYGDTVFALPAAREVLLGAFVDMLIGDCMATFAARALQSAPEQMSLWSSVTKFFVPLLMENVVREAATILGARYYLREHYSSGMFQKIVRDIAIVSLFDGSARLNISLIASQLGQITRQDASPTDASMESMLKRLEQTCSLSDELPAISFSKLALTNHGRDDLRQGLLHALEHFERLVPDSTSPVHAEIKLLLQQLMRERQALDQAVRNLVEQQGDIRLSVEGAEMAKRHCILHAAATCYYLWLFNRTALDEMFASGEWLVLCLTRLLQHISPRDALVLPRLCAERVTALLVRLLQEDRLFAIIPLQLASSHLSFMEAHALR
ncbi:MAG TPA: acyl-CoA dehydrogenase family protein [Ktedonobacteraceae bacterium]|nr:acyl-CoA dehydrogenase family protein [Ktedonobacteraceae bacterium]